MVIFWKSIIKFSVREYLVILGNIRRMFNGIEVVIRFLV